MNPVVNAFGCRVSPQLLLVALIKSDLHWTMHAAQKFSLEMNALETPAAIVEKTGTITEIHIPTKLDVTMAGIPVVIDDSMPVGTIELRDTDNKTLARIENLAIPTHFEY